MRQERLPKRQDTVERSELGDAFSDWNLARQSVQRVADLLEQDGLIVYEDNPAHRRAKLVRLTATGRRTLRRIQKAQRTWADAAGEQIGPTTLEAANAALARIIENLGR